LGFPKNDNINIFLKKKLGFFQKVAKIISIFFPKREPPKKKKRMVKKPPPLPPLETADGMPFVLNGLPGLPSFAAVGLPGLPPLPSQQMPDQLLQISNLQKKMAKPKPKPK